MWMTLFEDIVKAVVPIVIGGLLTWLVQKIGTIRSRTSRRKFWFGQSKELIVIYGAREMDMTPLLKKEALNIDVLKVVNVNDVAAVVNASSYLHKLGNVSVKSQDEADSLMKGNLLLIGGPIANSAAKEILERIDTYFHFNIPEKDIRQIMNKTGTNTISARFDGDYNLTQDVAWFYRGENPCNKENVVIITAGCFGYGTEAAVRYLTSEEFYKKIKNKPIKTIEGIVEVKVKNGKAYEPNLVALQGL